MLSVVNYGAIHGCTRCESVWDKVNYWHDSLTLVDIAIGIILCVVGALASHGVLAIGGANWMIGIGSAEIVIGVFMRFLSPCTELGCLAKSNLGELISQVRSRGQGMFNDADQLFEHRLS